MAERIEPWLVTFEEWPEPGDVFVVTRVEKGYDDDSYMCCVAYLEKVEVKDGKSEGSQPRQ